MLSKENRITKKKDFDKVFSQGKTVSSSFFFIRYLDTETFIKDGNSRFAVIVPMAVSNKAVARNKIKRRLRMIIYNLFPKIKTNFDITITVKQKAKDQKKLDLEAGLIKALNRARLLK